VQAVLTGGDDYELLFAAAPEDAARVAAAGRAASVAVTRIGRFAAAAGLRVRDASGDALRWDRMGWSHF
jgi:thiamine-monophosphate kinase